MLGFLFREKSHKLAYGLPEGTGKEKKARKFKQNKTLFQVHFTNIFKLI